MALARNSSTSRHNSCTFAIGSMEGCDQHMYYCVKVAQRFAKFVVMYALFLMAMKWASRSTEKV